MAGMTNFESEGLQYITHFSPTQRQPQLSQFEVCFFDTYGDYPRCLFPVSSLRDKANPFSNEVECAERGMRARVPFHFIVLEMLGQLGAPRVFRMFFSSQQLTRSGKYLPVCKFGRD